MNDKDGFICNVWRALKADPEGVAVAADWPVNENDLHARHIWLVGQRETLTARLEGDPEFYDVKIAGWWVWGICCWIGSGWCSGEGPWNVQDGMLVNTGDAGQGVNRQRVHLGDAGQGVNRQLDLVSWMQDLASRLARVRVCCGDWSRVCGPTPTVKLGLTGVFLDPPYDDAGRSEVYSCDAKGRGLVDEVATWAREWGNDPRMRIALCGYDGEHEMPGWDKVEWKAHGGYGSQGEGAGRENAHLERIWFSPHCLQRPQGSLFKEAQA